VGLGLSAMSVSDVEAATSHLQEALRSFRQLNEGYGVAHVTTFLGWWRGCAVTKARRQLCSRRGLRRPAG
jgi:hypothetical protein